MFHLVFSLEIAQRNNFCFLEGAPVFVCPTCQSQLGARDQQQLPQQLAGKQHVSVNYLYTALVVSRQQELHNLQTDVCDSPLQYFLVSSLNTDVLDITIHAEILPSTHNNGGDRKYFCMEQRGLCLTASMCVTRVHTLLSAVARASGQMRHAGLLTDTCLGRELFIQSSRMWINVSDQHLGI